MDKAKWMEENYQALQDKKLSELCLPGTHDSGTYKLYPEKDLAPDAEDTVKKLWDTLDNALGQREYIEGMARSQEHRIRHQLDNGARYIDLRVCWDEKDKEFRTCHSLFGDPIETLLNDLKDYLEDNRKEIVLVKVGFKELTGDQETEAGKLFSTVLGGLYSEYVDAGNAGKVIKNKLSEIVDSGKRAIFFSDSDSNIYGIYDEKKTTNSDVLENLKAKTTSFSSTTSLLEAQCFRPTSEEDYVKGFIGKSACRLLGPVIELSPFLAPVLAASGPLLVPALMAYFDQIAPVPTDLEENAKDSRSILGDYFQWLSHNPKVPRPNLVIVDFFTQVPEVELAILTNLGQPYGEKTALADDQPPAIKQGAFECGADAIAAALKMTGWALDEAGDFIKEHVPGIAGEALGNSLKAAGYGATEVGEYIDKLKEKCPIKNAVGVL